MSRFEKEKKDSSEEFQNKKNGFEEQINILTALNEKLTENASKKEREIEILRQSIIRKDKEYEEERQLRDTEVTELKKAFQPEIEFLKKKMDEEKKVKVDVLEIKENQIGDLRQIIKQKSEEITELNIQLQRS